METSTMNCARVAAAIALLWVAPATYATLTVTTAANPVVARPGELIDIEITVSNTDPVDRTGVSVSIVYPTGVVSIAPANFGGTCPPSFCDPGETITWNLGTLRAGRSITVDLPTAVAAATPDGTLISFDFMVTDNSAQTDTAGTIVEVDTATVYDIALRDSADPVVTGTLLTYRLIFGYREEAAIPATSIVRFPLPAGTSFVFASNNGLLVGDTVEWNVGSLIPGEGGVRTVAVNVNAADGEVLEAAAEIVNAGDATQFASTQALTVVDVLAPLGLQIDANADPAQPGEQLNVQLLVINNDPAPRSNLTLRLRYPDGVNSTFNGNINGGACPPTFCDPHEQLVFAIPSIAAQSTLLFNVAPFVAAATSDGTLVNFFAMLSDSAGGNATAIDSVRVRTGPKYDLAVRESVDPIVAGEVLTYKLTFGYREEAAAAADSRLRFVIPTGSVFDSASDGGTLIGNAVEWDLGMLSPGDGGFREIAVLVNAGALTSLRGVAGLFDTGHPSENVSAETLTSVHTGAALEVQVDANADPARPGEMLNVQYVVTNRDSVPRTVTLRGRYPDDVTAIFNGNIVWNPAGSCPPTFCNAGEMVTWNLGVIPAGHSVTVEISPNIAATAPDGVLINFFATATDTLGGMANSSDTVRVNSGSRYDLMINDSADPATPMQLLTYKLTFGHRADSPSPSNSVLRFRIPAGTNFVSASGGGSQSGDLVQWGLGNMNPGDGGVRAVTVQVDATGGSVLQAQGQIYTAGNLLRESAAEALTVVETTPALSLDVHVSSNPTQPNQLLETHFTVTNLDSNPRDVTLKVRYPDGLFSTSPSVNLIPPGSCPPSFCDPGEIVTWTLGSVPAGQGVVTTMLTTVHTATVFGQLVNFFAIATDTDGGIATSMETARLGTCVDDDTDCDGVDDSVDNCTFVDNADQRDTDGDNIGNICDADITGPGGADDCFVNFLDLQAVKAAFFATPVQPNWNPDADLDNSGSINFADLQIVKSQFFGPPGPSAGGCN